MFPTDDMANEDDLTEYYLHHALSYGQHKQAYSINAYRSFILLLVALTILSCLLFVFLFYRCLVVLDRSSSRSERHYNYSSSTQLGAEATSKQKVEEETLGRNQTSGKKGHLMVVLGSGGHTAEMMAILENLGAGYVCRRFARRTYVVSAGDSFSSQRAKRFEEEILDKYERAHSITTGSNKDDEKTTRHRYNIVTVTRARKIHQPLVTTPISCLRCLYDCLRVLRHTHPDLSPSTAPGSYPDLILLNGPATSIILVLASFLLQYLGLAPSRHALRPVYIESFARVQTLSLSGKIMKHTGLGRLLVQWPQLAAAAAAADDDEQDTSRRGDVSAREGKAGGIAIGEEWSRRCVEYVGPVVA